MMQVIHIHPGGAEYSFHAAKRNDVRIILLHGLQWPLALRQNPPRVRLLVDGEKGVATPCEILDPWPDAPEHWPPLPEPKLEVAA